MLGLLTICYTESTSRIGILAKSCLEFEPGEAGAEAVQPE
ncbi:hypothetical protein wcw_0083 [Waddlia chondrophila WSU 86-1044]|uniref:Uncharacterized protein n=1 Tax=Waddlia chondrophila (strain ATCC VR-1470 / WSU 86-1044) TaxID=716544 RepID=D6YTJ7_WADCW|nr:hypothetical protein wcw_0083 [Waddlia chondrophila WSU 86-1044]